MIENSINNSIIEEGISLNELFSILLKKIHIIIITIITSIIVAIIYLNYATYEYKTSITVMIEPLKSNSQVGELISDSVFSSGTDISTEVQLLTNITNLNLALDKLDLSKYTNADGLDYTNRNVLGNIKNKITINTYKGTNLVELSVQDPNPEFAADYANAIANSFNEMLTGYGQESKNTQIEFLEKQIPTTEKKINDATDKLFSYKAETGIDFLSNNTSTLVNYISYLQMRIKPLELQKIKNNSLVEEYQEKFNNTLPPLNIFKQDNKVQEYIKSYENSYSEFILFDIVSNNNKTTTNSVDLNVGMNDRIIKLNNQMSNSKRQIFNRLNEIIRDYSITKDEKTNELYSTNNYLNIMLESLICNVEIDSIKENIISFEQEFNKLPSVEKELSKLQSDVESLELIRRELNSLLEQVSLTAAAQTNSVKLISPALIPITPISPNKLLILAISVLIGAAISVLICLILHFNDDTIHKIDDLKSISSKNVPILGWIPLIACKKPESSLSDLLINQNPESYLTERFKILTSNIIYGRNSEKKIFTVTSCGINEGKSFFTCNFGICLAQQGYNVLIIDSDIKSPSIERFFNLKNDRHGFVKVLQEDTSIEDIIKNPIKKLPNLQIISPGETDILPSIFYKKTDFKSRVNELREKYDYVLIDEPPLEFASDLLSFIKYVDAILVCTRLGICTKSKFQLLKEQLSIYQEKIGGIIATACPYENVKTYINRYGSYYHHYIDHNLFDKQDKASYEFIKTEKKSKKMFKQSIRSKKKYNSRNSG